jgi:hypothetical protein
VPCWLVVLAAPVHYNPKNQKNSRSALFVSLLAWQWSEQCGAFCVSGSNRNVDVCGCSSGSWGLQLSSNSSGMHSPYAFSLRALLSLYLRCLRYVWSGALCGRRIGLISQCSSMHLVLCLSGGIWVTNSCRGIAYLSVLALLSGRSSAAFVAFPGAILAQGACPDPEECWCASAQCSWRFVAAAPGMSFVAG